MALLRYRAGQRAKQLLCARGLTAETLAGLVAPAVGPKWLAMVGLDQALMGSGWLKNRRSALAIHGASAGAFRAMALASADPQAAYGRLVSGYIAQVFSQWDDPRSISRAFQRMLTEVFTAADVRHALQQRDLALSIAVNRGRGPLATARPWTQRSALGLAFALNAWSPRRLDALLERIRFEYVPDGTGELARAMFTRWRERSVPLLRANMHTALLASATVPTYMAPVDSPAAAPAGLYLDGGLRDYHLGRSFDTGGRGVILVLLHQRRMIPGWFDKFWPHRRPPQDWLQDVLLVHPDDAWVRRLPGGQVPTRQDFVRFVDRPQARMAQWREVVEASERLGQRFLEDLNGGEIPRQLEPI